MRRGLLFMTLAMAGVLAVGTIAVSPSAAQGPATPGAPDGRRPGGTLGGGFGSTFGGLLGFTACSTTDYTNVAAQALGMTAADLRVALVSGKSLSSLASSKNITLQTIGAALAKAQAGDIDQAVTDGLLTQTQADAIKARLSRIETMAGAAGSSDATPSATDQATPTNPTQPNDPRNGGRPFFPGGPMAFGVGGMGISAHTPVHVLAVAAQAIGISCADLVKALAQRQSIAQVASGKSVQAQTVIDALVKARQDALAQDVKDGLITQAQADGRSANLTQAMTALVNGGLRGQRGFGGFGGGTFPGQRGTGGMFPGLHGSGFFNIGRLFQWFGFGGRSFPGFGGGMFPGPRGNGGGPFPGFGNGGRRGNGNPPATPSATEAAGSST